MAFADIFSSENFNRMASDPRMALGLALMSRGKQGGLAQGIGAAGLDTMQLLQQQQAEQQKQAYMQAMQDQMNAAAQDRQAQAAEAARMRQAMQSPDFLATLDPRSRALAIAGASPEMIVASQRNSSLDSYRQQQLDLQRQRLNQQSAGSGAGSAAKTPTPSNTLDEPLGDGRYQRHRYNAAIGGYEPFGKPFKGKQPDPAEEEEDAGPIAGHAGTPSSPLVDKIVGGALNRMAPPSPLAPKPSPQRQGIAVDRIVDNAVAQIMPPTGAKPPASKPQGIVAGGSVPPAAPSIADPSIAAAQSAIARGADPAAVRQRLKAAGYTDQQLRAAGL
ncbi:hypothetical protein FQZ97_378690 [compost metagenome]